MNHREREMYAGTVYVTGMPLSLSPRSFEGLYLGGLLCPYYPLSDVYLTYKQEAIRFLSWVIDFWKVAGVCPYIYLKD